MNRLRHIIYLVLAGFFLFFAGEVKAMNGLSEGLSEVCLEASDDIYTTLMPSLSDGENIIYNFTEDHRQNSPQRERRSTIYGGDSGFISADDLIILLFSDFHGLSSRNSSVVHRSVAEKCSIILLIRSIRI
ncbi:MAG: hypothetical protein IBJ09_12270 [Bacteroidia bacterium]|nr:hypothetical protein [Bacteroidia bacterium]